MNFSDIPQIAEMTVPEKIVFLEDLWDSIAEQEQAVPVPDSHIREFERRLAEYRANPSKLLTLEELQQKIYCIRSQTELFLDTRSPPSRGQAPRV